MARSCRCVSLLVLVLQVVLAGPATGCSYGFVRGPSPVIERAPVDPQSGVAKAAGCTASNAAPILDTFGAVVTSGIGGIALLALAETESCNSSGPWGGLCMKDSAAYVGVAAAAFSLAAIYIASAATGYGRTADCRKAQHALPVGPHPSVRHLLDVEGIAEARARRE